MDKGKTQINGPKGEKLIIPNALHPRDDIDSLYVSKNQGVRGLAIIENWVDASTQCLEDNIRKKKD